MELVVQTPSLHCHLFSPFSSSLSLSLSFLLCCSNFLPPMETRIRLNEKGTFKQNPKNEFKEEEEDEELGLGFGEDDKKRKSVGKNGGVGVSSPCCQADKCNSDLTDAKKYHRRHKVCEFHSKAPVVIVGGLRQRFCQQCSRFHELSEFDDTKKSCRRRLAGHNERRRKCTSESHGEGSSRERMNPQLENQCSDQIGKMRLTLSGNAKHFQMS